MNNVLGGGGGIRGRKYSFPLGYSDTQCERLFDVTLAAGNNTLNGATVPAGEIWVYTTLAFAYVGTPPTSIEVAHIKGGIEYTIYGQLLAATTQNYNRQGHFVLKEGENMRITVYGATLNDDLWFWLNGYRMDVDQ